MPAPPTARADRDAEHRDGHAGADGHRDAPRRNRPPRHSRPRRPRRSATADGVTDRDGHAAPTATPSPTATAAPSSTPIAPADPRDAATAYRQNPAHDGRAFGDGPQPPLTTAWTRDLDGNLTYPLIAGGRVFALTDKGMLRVLDLRNGALLWSHAIGTRPVTAAYDDGRVFTTDEYGLTIAFDAASGLVLWSRSTSAQSPPVASDGRLYTGGTGALTVYDAATGELLRSQEGRRSGDAVMLTLDADKVYAATRCGGAIAYHRDAPGIAWQGPEGGCSTGQWSLPGALQPAGCSTRTRSAPTTRTARSATRRPARSSVPSRRARRPRSPAAAASSSRAAR